VTLRLAVCPDAIVWLGRVHVSPAAQVSTVIVAVFESALPAEFDTRTQ